MTDPLTPLQALLHQANTRPDKAAVVADAGMWSYRRLAEESERIAQGLRARGIKPGDRVALHLTNRIELVLAYYACFRLGAIAAPLNVRLTSVELEDLAGRLGASLFIGEENLRSTFGPIATDVLPLSARVIVNLRGDHPVETSFDKLLSSGGDDGVIPHPSTDLPAVIIPTSGTTDKPKFAVWTPQTLASGAAKLTNIHLDDGRTALIATPMVHGAALTFLLGSVMFGGTAVLLRQFDADRALHLIEEHKVAWIFGLPTMMAGLVDRQRAAPRVISSLRVCLVAGDVSTLDLHAAFADVFGRQLRSVLASTEIGWPFLPGGAPVAIGRVPAGLTFAIVDNSGCDLGTGEEGELYICERDCLSIGYWHGAGRIESTASSGWFATGDIVRLDEAGDLWFVARAKDIIVRGGSNISPAEIEAVLIAHPAVKEAAVVGIADGAVGERVAAALVIEDRDGPPPLDEILAFARTRLAAYKLPEHVEIMQSLPRSSIGKLDRKRLRGLMGA